MDYVITNADVTAQIASDKKGDTEATLLAYDMALAKMKKEHKGKERKKNA